MSYRALYREWRPETFSDVLAQDKITSTMRRQIETGRIPHAYLLCGSRGTGKTSTAKVLARAVNCLNPKDGDPCGVCDACVQLSQDNNMDIIEIDAASNNGVDEVRDLRDKIKYPPSIGRYKVYIIDEVHMLSTGAFNALLKTLEEPPPHAIFILATTEPHKLPATILSRCQRYDFRRIPASVIEDSLKNIAERSGATFDDESISMIARAAEGGMRDALSILDMCLAYGSGNLTSAGVREVLGSTDRAVLFDFAAAMISGDAGGALGTIDNVIRDGRDPAVFAREVVSHMRALLVALTCGEGTDELLEITKEDEARYIGQAQSGTEAQFLRIMDIFMRCEGDMKWSSSQRTMLEMCAVRACRPEEERGGGALEERIAQIEKALSDGSFVKPAPGRTAAPVNTDSAKPVKPAEASAPPVNIEAGPAGDDEAYKGALKLVSKKSANVCIMLKKGKLTAVNGNSATIAFYPADEVYVDLLSQQDKREIIEQCLTESFARPMQAVFSTLNPAKAAESPSAGRKQLDEIMDAFGRENVEIIDDN